MLRLLHLGVIALLVLAAAYVYKIKFDAAVQAERVAKIRNEVRREREAIAYLRAQWSRLDTPGRIEELAKRHLELKAVEANQFDDFGKLPMRPKPIVPPDAADAIAALIGVLDTTEAATGSTAAPPAAAAAPTAPPSPEN
jgi:hypothetical protein